MELLGIDHLSGHPPRWLDLQDREHHHAGRPRYLGRRRLDAWLPAAVEPLRSECASTVDGTSGEEIQRKLQAAIDTLPEKQKAVFVLKYFEEKKYDEISTILGTSVGALKASYHHAVKKIEEFLKDD